MRICLITYEYPPATGIGGIGTYMYQLSKAFERKKIATEVICASSSQNTTVAENDYLTITKIKCATTEEFRKLVPGVAAKRFAQTKFDIIECSEFGAAGLYIKKELPGVPIVIKLHTPRFLIKEMNDYYYDQLWWRKWKKKVELIFSVDNDPEYKAVLQADHVTSPSLSLMNIVLERWKIPADKITHIPNPYFPSAELLNIPAGAASKTVLYIGRLETRKGVYNLAKAIPEVVKKIPDVRFVFLGKDSRGVFREKSMKKVLEKELGTAISHTRFIDQVPLEEIPGFLAEAHTCIFPSIWENFPNVCLEAMSAARNVIAGQYGGMKDMLEDTGKHQLVDPHNVHSIASHLIALLEKEGNKEIVLKNRNKVLLEYGDAVIEKTLKLYQSVIKK